MGYETIVRYGKKTVKFKVNKIDQSGNYVLPEFLKTIRMSNGHSYGHVHMITDYPEEECRQMEEGAIPITQNFLENFAEGYKLPKKLAKIGYDPDKEGKFELADRLYDLRIKKNMTQGEIAYSIGVARTTCAGYETGQNEPDLKTLVKIADLYGVSLDYLAGRY